MILPHSGARGERRPRSSFHAMTIACRSVPVRIALLVSGFLLFTVLAGSYAAVTPFRLKVLIVGLAILSGLSIQWMVPAWDRAPVMPLAARLAALISIVLWLGAILVSVEIPALTGLG